MTEQENFYYVRKRGWIYELCQNRYRNQPNHPHTVCAVNTSQKGLKEMYDRYFSGGVDWLDEVNQNE